MEMMRIVFGISGAQPDSASEGCGTWLRSLQPLASVSPSLGGGAGPRYISGQLGGRAGSSTSPSGGAVSEELDPSKKCRARGKSPRPPQAQTCHGLPPRHVLQASHKLLVPLPPCQPPGQVRGQRRLCSPGAGCTQNRTRAPRLSGCRRLVLCPPRGLGLI